jgi:hypothetical protein
MTRGWPVRRDASQAATLSKDTSVCVPTTLSPGAGLVQVSVTNETAARGGTVTKTSSGAPPQTTLIYMPPAGARELDDIVTYTLNGAARGRIPSYFAWGCFRYFVSGGKSACRRLANFQAGTSRSLGLVLPQAR